MTSFLDLGEVFQDIMNALEKEHALKLFETVHLA